MLTIRPEQMVVFSRSEREKFEQWMVGHLQRFFPKESYALDGTPLRETVCKGIERAGAYRIRSKRDVCKFIDLMVALGPDFETNGQFPWAGEILAKKWGSGARMKALLAEVQRRVTATRV